MAYLAGSYTAIDWDAAAQAMNASATSALNPANMTRVDLGVVWSPVKGFKITPDVEWARVNAKVATNYGAVGEGAAKKSESAWTGRIQIRRDF